MSRYTHFFSTQYLRPTKTKNCFVLISQRLRGTIVWNIAQIKKFYYFPFGLRTVEKEYAFAAVVVHEKVPPEIDPKSGFRVVRKEPDNNIEIIAVKCIKSKVVLLKFSEHLTPGRRPRHDGMLALENYK